MDSIIDKGGPSFNDIRWKCVTLIRDENIVKSSSSLLDSVRILPDTCDSRFVFHLILLPVRAALSKVNSLSAIQGESYQPDTEKACANLLEILEMCAIRCGTSTFADENIENVFEVFSQLLNEIMLLLNEPGSDQVKGSDYLVNAVLHCVKILLDKLQYIGRLPADVDKKVKLVLAYLTRALLQIFAVKNDILALDCLESLLSLNDSITCSFLPGICASLYKFVEDCAKCTSANYSNLSILIKSISIIKNVAKIGLSKSVDQSADWRNQAKVRIGHLFDSLIKCLLNHPNAAYKRCLYDFVQNILIDADNLDLLNETKKKLLDCFAALCADSDIGTSANDTESLSTKMANFQADLHISLRHCCRRISNFSRKTTLDYVQAIEWQQLVGDMLILGSTGLSHFLLNDSNMRLLCDSLIDCIEFDQAVWHVNPEITLSRLIVDEEVDCNISCIKLSNPGTLKTQDLFQRTLGLLLCSDEFDLVIDYLYDRFSVDKTPNRRKIAYFINAMLKLAASKDDSHRNKFSDCYITSNLLLSYLSWLEDAIGYLNDDNSVNLDVCLILDGISGCFVFLGQQSQSCLIKSLYYLLLLFSKLPTKNFALNCLESIAASLKFDSAQNLLKSHLDYLCYSIVIKLKSLSLNPDSPIVLESCLLLISWTELDQLRSAIVECLCALDNCKQGSNWPIITSLIDCLSKFCLLCSKLPFSVQEHRKNNENEDEIDEDSVIEEPNDSVTWHIQTVVSILQSVRCWMICESLMVRIACLQCLLNGLKALQNTQNQLLPIIHQTWPFVLDRLRDNQQPSCQLAAFDVIYCEACLGGSFIRRRFIDDAWPVIEHLLLQKSSFHGANPTARLNSPSYRLRLNICNRIGDLIGRLDAWPLEHRSEDVGDSASFDLKAERYKDDLVQRCRRTLLKLVENKDPLTDVLDAARRSLASMETIN